MTVAAPAPTRQRLLDATTELLAEGGYAAATVSALTSRAGVASGTLYRHFASKEELFVEIFRSLSGRELGAMREAAGGEVVPLDRLEAAIDAFARRALAEPRVAWALLAEPVDALVDAERLEYRRRYRDLVVDLLDDASPALAAAIVGGVGEALVGPTAEPPSSPQDRAALIAEIKAFARRAATT
ncbi:MAG: TetR/AcrR family transcriptional regulator [Solirubrobacterales bacterium]